MQVADELAVTGVGDEQDAPHEREHGGRDTERNNVRKRIEFPAEVAGRVRHPRDAPVQAVKENRKSKRLRRRDKVLIWPVISAAHLHRAIKRLQHRDEPKEDVAARE